MRIYRAYKAVLAVLAAGCIVVACGGRNESTPQAVVSGLGPKPDYKRSNFNLGDTQPTVLGDINIQPLSVSISGGSATVSLWGSPCAPGQAGYQFCPGQNYTTTPPQIVFSVPTILQFAAASLNASCPAAKQCYVVAYEGAVGPYVVQGPVSGSAPLALPAQTAALNFNNATGYNFFLASASGISSLPPALTPSPAPTATTFYTPAPPASSPTPIATVTPCNSGHHRGGDNSCCSSDDGGDRGDHYSHNGEGHNNDCGRGGDRGWGD